MFGATRPFLHQRHRKSIKIKEENGGCESHGKNPNTVPDAPPTKPARFIHKNAEQQNIYTNMALKNSIKRNHCFVLSFLLALLFRVIAKNHDKSFRCLVCLIFTSTYKPDDTLPGTNAKGPEHWVLALSRLI
ncbi:hypothetical protein PQ786_06820 [Alcaligenes faecalis]|uniref:hypothetical protein n=1 Tax=Alcaligenes TaxID=507 RepID=UPI0010CBFCCC|nr:MULTISPECIES: hypothetical protein [Alcaligenes]